MEIPKYSYVEHPRFEQAGFRIADGKYENVIYTYGKVKPIEEDDKLRLKFEYNVHENPNDVDTDSDEFINMIGDILTLEIDKEKNDNSREDRENGSQESTT
jgi:hypothetical protein